MIVFDLETQNLASEVGGWHNLELLRLAVACTWDERYGYRLWWESQAADLVEELDRAEFIVGYNTNKFDFGVLSLYGDTSEFAGKTFDILDAIFEQAHKRVGLNVVANINLGQAKAEKSGANAVLLWRTGKLEELAGYCQRDVELTKDVFEFWENQGLLWVNEVEFVVWPGIYHLMDDEE